MKKITEKTPTCKYCWDTKSFSVYRGSIICADFGDHKPIYNKPEIEVLPCPKCEPKVETIESLDIDSLRQWLNEDRITNPKKLVTNKEIWFMLGVDKKFMEKK